MKACMAFLCILLVAGCAYGKAVADNPSFMMVGGISAAAEMCLAAADGLMFSFLVLACCFPLTWLEEVSAPKGQLSLWSPVLLQLLPGMGASCGKPTAPRYVLPSMGNNK